jgi:hypothetical protein
MDDFSDLQDEDFGLDEPDFSSDLPAQGFDEPDEFDQLRESSARTETLYNDMDEDTFIESGGGSGSGFSLSNFSPGQRLALAILVVLNILMIGFGLLVVLGVVGG